MDGTDRELGLFGQLTYDQQIEYVAKQQELTLAHVLWLIRFLELNQPVTYDNVTCEQLEALRAGQPMVRADGRCEFSLVASPVIAYFLELAIHHDTESVISSLRIALQCFQSGGDH